MEWTHHPGGAGQPDRGTVPVNLIVSGHRTSIRLEPEILEALHDIASREDTSVHAIATRIAASKSAASSLSSAIRVQVLCYYRRLVR